MKEYKNQPISKKSCQSQGKINLLLKKNLFLIPLLAFFTLSPFSCAFFWHKNESNPQLEERGQKIEASERALSGRGIGRGQAVKEGIDYGSDLLKSIRLFFSRVGPKAKSIEYSRFNTKWKEWGEAVLRRNLTETEAKALSDAYYIRYFTPNSIKPFEAASKDKALAELVNFTDDDVKNLLLKERKWILNQAGFTDEEINILLLGDTKHKNMFDKERHINEQWREVRHEYYNNKSKELPQEIQDLIPKHLDENRQKLRESLENGELKEGVSPFIFSLHDYSPYKIVQIHNPNEITVQNLNGELKTLTDVFISPIERYIGHTIGIASPEVSKLFSAIASTRRRVTIEELNLPLKRDLPPLPSSYGPEYTSGWTQIQEGIAFAKAIRELDPLPNPYKTHIEWFVPQISKSIENAREILRQMQNPEETVKTIPSLISENDVALPLPIDKIRNMLEKIDLLEQQALQRVQEEEVTYSWWLKFNSELIKETNPGRIYTDPFGQTTADKFARRIKYDFPIKIALPIKQMDHKELGIMSINRANQNNVAPIEFNSILVRDIDGYKGGIFAFYDHDLQHAQRLFESRKLESFLRFPLREAEKTHIQFIDNLQGEERTQMENIYFLNMHENTRIIDIPNDIFDY